MYTQIESERNNQIDKPITYSAESKYKNKMQPRNQKMRYIISLNSIIDDNQSINRINLSKYTNEWPINNRQIAAINKYVPIKPPEYAASYRRYYVLGSSPNYTSSYISKSILLVTTEFIHMINTQLQQKMCAGCLVDLYN